MATNESSMRVGYRDITIGGEARAHLGDLNVTNHIHVTSDLAREVYRTCAMSSEKFRPIAREISDFRSILEITEETAAHLGPGDKYADSLISILSGCKECLNDIQSSVIKYNDLPTASQWTWDRLEWGVEEFTQLRDRMGRSLSVLNALNISIVSSSQKAVQSKLHKYMEEIRSGKREGSVLSTSSMGNSSAVEKEAWKNLRKDLEDIGITPGVFDENRKFIIETLKGITFENSKVVLRLSESVVLPSNKSFLEAVRAGNLPKVKEMLTNGSDIEAQEELIEISLFLACRQDNAQIIRVLVDHGANIEAQSKIGETPLLLACRKGSLHASRVLLELGANTEVILPKRLQKVDQPKMTGRTALIDACAFRNAHLASMLLSSGANIEARDSSQQTALIVAASCQNMDLKVVELLFAKGANLEQRNSRGRSALMAACACGDTNIVEFLLQSGADIETRDCSGQTPLIVTASIGRAAIVRQLLSRGADISAKDNYGETALQTAFQRGHFEILEEILKTANNGDQFQNEQMREYLQTRRLELLEYLP